MTPGEYPERPVRVLVPLPPGGATEFSARIVAGRLAALLGQPFVLEHRLGDAGIAALRELAGADPHTLMVGSVNTNSIVPVLFPERLGFDYDTRVTPVSRLTEFPSVLVVSAGAPATTVRAFLDDAHAARGAVRNGTDWIGSYPDIDGVRLAEAAGVPIVHVPRSGGADGLLAALVAGEIDMLFLNARTAGAGIRAGRIKALAVTGPARLRGLPDVPTMAEAGFAGIGTTHWQGLFAPGTAPAAAVRRLHRAVIQALASGEVRAAFEAVDARATPSASPEQFAAEIRAERVEWERVRPALALGSA